MSISTLSRPKVRTALISGPYGVSIPIINFDTILMVASGYGIAAQMPYLEKLLASGKGPLAYNIHVVWLISTLDILNSAANCSLNRLLEEDLQRVLLISIYSNSNEVHYSRYGERAASFKGDPDFSKIISGEINENFFTKGSNFGETGKMLVLVSANEKCRSRLKRGLRESLNKNQKLSLLGGDTQRPLTGGPVLGGSGTGCLKALLLWRGAWGVAGPPWRLIRQGARALDQRLEKTLHVGMGATHPIPAIAKWKGWHSRLLLKDESVRGQPVRVRWEKLLVAMQNI
ncbi:hypothetical protein RB601_003662 [Gaeumannomyces tritici]